MSWVLLCFIYFLLFFHGKRLEGRVERRNEEKNVLKFCLSAGRNFIVVSLGPYLLWYRKGRNEGREGWREAEGKGVKERRWMGERQEGKREQSKRCFSQ